MNLSFLFLLLPLATEASNRCPRRLRARYDRQWKKVVEGRAYHRMSGLIGNFVKEKWRVWAHFEHQYTRGVEYNLPKCTSRISPCKPCVCSTEPLGQWKKYPQVQPVRILPLVSIKIACGNYTFSDSAFSKQLMDSLNSKTPRCQEAKVWDCANDCATACYCSNCQEDPCCNYMTYGQRLDCLFLGQAFGAKPGAGSTPVKAGTVRGAPVIDLPAVNGRMPPVIGLLNNVTNVDGRAGVSDGDDEDEKGKIPEDIAKLLAPLPPLSSKNPKGKENFYRRISRKITKQKKKEEKLVKRTLAKLKRQWSSIAKRTKRLQERFEFLNALKKRGMEVKKRLEKLQRKRPNTTEDKKQRPSPENFGIDGKKPNTKTLQIVDVALAMKRKANFLGCRKLVKKHFQCFDTMSQCIEFVQQRCRQSLYRSSYVNRLLCIRVSC